MDLNLKSYVLLYLCDVCIRLKQGIGQHDSEYAVGRLWAKPSLYNILPYQLVN